MRFKTFIKLTLAVFFLSAFASLQNQYVNAFSPILTPTNGASNISTDYKPTLTLTFIPSINDLNNHTEVKDLTTNSSIQGRWTYHKDKGIFSYKPNIPFYGLHRYQITINEGLTGEPITRELFRNRRTPILERSLVTQFTTGKAKRRLNLPQYYQPYSLSCELTSLRMALKYKGVNVGKSKDAEMKLLGHIGYAEPYAKYWHWGAWRWADPETGWVGDVNGIFHVTGYGTSAQQLHKATKVYRPNSFFKYNWNKKDLVKEIHLGNPVIFWYAISQPTHWYTPAGKYIPGMQYHVIVATGYDGTIENPERIYFNDPLHGKVSYSMGLIDYYWSKINKQAVIVR